MTKFKQILLQKRLVKTAEYFASPFTCILWTDKSSNSKKLSYCRDGARYDTISDSDISANTVAKRLREVFIRIYVVEQCVCA